MAGSGLMTIEDLVRSSAYIYSERFYHGQYKRTYTHSIASAITKTMGTIYYNNKVVIYNEDSGILEIRMGMGTKTETAYTGMHAIRMALYGVEGKIYDSLGDLYQDQVGRPMDAHDENEMKKAIRGETTIGDRYNTRKASDERTENNLPGRKSSSTGEANKFKVSYSALDPNAVLSGYIIPVAAMNPDTGAYTFKEDGKVFYMEKPITIDTICRVSCSCSDYFYSCAWYNYAHGVHLGQQPAAYPGKSSMSKTVKNVEKQPGMCKHLMMFTMLLLNGGIISKEGTVNFENNINVLRNRPEKLSIAKKLADKGDWNRHLQELNRSLFKADKARKSQMIAKAGNKQYELTPDGYYDWSAHKVAQRVGKGYKNIHKGLTKDRYTSQGALDTFQQAMKMAGANDIEMAKVLGAYGRGTRRDTEFNRQQVDWYKRGNGHKPYWHDL